MTYPEYILAFESILYGLIITRIVDQWNRIIQNRSEYKHYWAFYLLTISVFLMIAYVYLSNFHPDRYSDFMGNYRGFVLFGVLPPTCFAFISFQMFPPKKEKDQKKFVFTNRVVILLPSAVYFSFFTAYRFFLTGFGIEIAFALGIIALTIATMFIKRYWFLETYIVLSFAMSIFLMFTSLN